MPHDDDVDAVPPRPPQQPQHLLPTMLGSATSGILARIPLHPIDTVKAKLQVMTTPSPAGSSRPGPVHTTSMLDCFRQTWRGFPGAPGGLRGLYAGFAITVVGSAPATCLYLTAFELSKPLLRTHVFTSQAGEHSDVINFSAGLLAEALSCMLFVPIDVIKERLQVQSHVTSQHATRYTGSVHAVREIMRTEGLFGIYKGYGATLASFGPFSAIYLSCYERIKHWAVQRWMPPVGAPGQQRDVPFALHFCSAGLAGGFAALVTNPLDMAKLRLQVQRSQRRQHVAQPFAFAYRNIVHGLVSIAQQEGVRGLFKGAPARILFHAPSTSITMALFQSARAFWDKALYGQDEL